MNEGWAMPLVVTGALPTKYHYFVGNISLCGRWFILGRVHVVSRDDDDPGNCTVCHRRLRKRRMER